MIKKTILKVIRRWSQTSLGELRSSPPASFALRSSLHERFKGDRGLKFKVERCEAQHMSRTVAWHHSRWRAHIYRWGHSGSYTSASLCGTFWQKLHSYCLRAIVEPFNASSNGNRTHWHSKWVQLTAKQTTEIGWACLHELVPCFSFWQIFRLALGNNE